jgi:small subunit ribosomal protein S16
MAVKIRMTRMGRRHRPFYRINAVESRTPRDGRILEKLGHYDPIEKDASKQVVLNTERVQYWLGQGAVTSDTVAEILKKKGIPCPKYEEKLKRRQRALAIARKKGLPFTKAEKEAAGKPAEPAAEEPKS